MFDEATSIFLDFKFCTQLLSTVLLAVIVIFEVSGFYFHFERDIGVCGIMVWANFSCVFYVI